MKVISTLLLISLAPMLVSCGGDVADREASAGSEARQVAVGSMHPCDAFTVTDVASRFAIAEGAITAERGELPGKLTCSYERAKPDSAAIEERNTEILMAALGPDGDGMAERLENGITASAGEKSVTFTSSFDPVNGVGGKAVWSERLRQLSVASGAQLYHVRLHGNANAELDRPGAEEVGREIAAALG